MGCRIHLLAGVGFDSNVYLIEDEKIALIDAGTGRLHDALMENVRERGVDPEDIELLINTHCHYDHTGGDHKLSEATGCRVLIHELEQRVLEEGDNVLSCAVLFGERLRPVRVHRALRENDLIELGALALRVLHTPGHTAGSICLHDPDRGVLFTGDTVFTDGVGRTDLPTGSASELVASLKRLNQLKVRELYPGHGPPNDRDPRRSLRSALDFLLTQHTIE